MNKPPPASNPSQDNSTNREYWLDALRVFAAFAVVLLHVSASVVTINGDMSGGNWWVGNFFDSVTRWCVPVFVMISGSLLLAKPASENPLAFYKRRLSRIVTPLAVWSLVYLVVNWYSGRMRDPEEVKTAILTGNVYFHLWYLFMLLGLYLAVPFVQRFVWSLSRRQLGRITAFSLVASIVYNYALPYVFTTQTIFLLTFPPYIAYLMAGYYIASAEKPVVRPRTAAILALVSGILIALFTGILAETLGAQAWGIMYSYHNPLVNLMSLCLFSLAKDVLGRRQSDGSFSARWLGRIAPLTFGIYVIHPLFFFIAWQTPVLDTLQAKAIGIPIITPLAFGFAAALTAVLLRIPLLRRAVS